ncbi:hypothetical protein SAY86_009506 [Trapa natans]|uniref:THIF-type NAD/FAD binding fold domain-containing protein n=1 Tax=Trapa natans TaxID=22666 RepID=A0AAN7QRA7_TRANT|nr:hypothetical protein SAY86_009506 [Trapa natans]
MDDINPKLFRNFAFGSRVVINPMAAMFGGIVGQEVVKACSGKYHPLFQFSYFDSMDSLPTESSRSSDYRPQNSHYNAQISVIGAKLENAEVFIVGSGALGREFLKNLALQGVSCGDQGKLTVTDDDVIEKSNIGRQFLFRDWNIGQVKSTVAASAVEVPETEYSTTLSGNAEVFIVGSGALGCEFLKNSALQEDSCGDQGKLTVTDDDVIEKSNIGRQFLF